jgi:hypothetical protein
LGDLKG